MAYVAVRGGKTAIEESMKRLKYERVKGGETLDVDQAQQGLRLLVDQVMSEASLYAPELAALAIKQGEGSMEEAVFLLRAYRSTLPRTYYSTIVESSSMEVERRISAAFKDIPKGQILGTSYDYTHRLLDFDLLDEKEAELQTYINQFYEQETINVPDTLQMEKVTDYLRKEGLLAFMPDQMEEPLDVTKEMLRFPTTRAQRLQILTRGMTQAVTALGYASLRGYGSVHPTVGELRVGKQSITVANPMNIEDDDDAYTIGEIKVSEVESLIPVTMKTKTGESKLEFRIGYGIALGQNETKAIAMSILDQCLESEEKIYAVNDEEFVLYHIDAVEATGFISHLKLPHYVTFQSKLNSIRKTKKEKEHETNV